MGAFSNEARSQCDILQAMAQKMEELYTHLSEYFVFDKQKYTLEEFMGDIKQFKDQFKVRAPDKRDNISRKKNHIFSFLSLAFFIVFRFNSLRKFFWKCSIFIYCFNFF